MDGTCVAQRSTSGTTVRPPLQGRFSRDWSRMTGITWTRAVPALNPVRAGLALVPGLAVVELFGDREPAYISRHSSTWEDC